jgi:hypothetical protein
MQILDLSTIMGKVDIILSNDGTTQVTIGRIPLSYGNRNFNKLTNLYTAAMTSSVILYPEPHKNAKWSEPIQFIIVDNMCLYITDKNKNYRIVAGAGALPLQ